ncbi:MAG: PAS domain-containing sensor histidine kinase [Nitrospira sp.]
MATKPAQPQKLKKLTKLRREAEELLQASNRDITAMSVKDVHQLVHELRVHQVELEMQNEELRRTQEKLEVARDRYAELYDCSPAGHLTLDASGTVVEANLRAATLLGINRKDLIEQPLSRFVASEDQDRLHGHCQEVLKTGTRQTCEVHMQKEAGAVCCVYLESLAVHEVPGHFTHWRTSLMDITERKRAVDALREREYEFHLLADNVPAYFAYIDTELRYGFVNKRYEALFGRPLAELDGQLVKDVVGEANFHSIEPYLRETLAGRESFFIYLKVLPNGDSRWMKVRYTPDRNETGGIRGVLALMTDVTAQKQAELALQQNQLVLEKKQNELQRLTEKLFMAQDSERQRIARDLHDDFSQRLTALVLDVASLQRHPPRVPELIGKALEPVCTELEQLTRDLHDLAYRLHPPLLRHAGLQAAIEDHIQKAIERTGLCISLKAKDVPGAIPLEWSLCLFRVLQESLQNIVKHAKATEVLVKLSGSSHGIGLSVIDNGTGFDKRGHQKGLGLISMQERLRLLNGFLNIHSRPADGTKVCAWIPFPEQTR